MSSSSESATGRFAARPRKGVLFGFSGPRLTVLAIAVAVAVVALFLAGIKGVLVAAPAFAILAAAAFVRVSERTAVEWAPVAGHWALRRALHQDIYCVRPTRPRPAGTLALPGDAAALRVHLDRTSNAAMIYDPHRGTLAVSCLITHPAFVLLGGDEQARRVAAWGRALALLARSGHISSIQVLEATLPDHGTAVLDWWDEHGVHDGSWPARTYGEFIAAAAPSSARHRTTVTLSLDLHRAARAIGQAGRGLAGAAALLRQHMAVIEAALRTAELRPQGWLNEAQLALVLRGAYDPSGASAIEPTRVGRRLETAGPVGMREHWSWLEHDGSASAVLWISEWPRSNAYPNFLHSLLLQPNVRKSFSLTARPVPIADARREIRRQKVEYLTDAEQKARIGQVADLSDAQEYRDILDREQEINIGHADMRFAGLLAVTAPSKPELDAAVAEVEQAALHAECDTRLLVGQQSQAFAAAALPLGRALA